MRKLGLSERFACKVAGQSRSVQRYTKQAKRKDDPDASLRAYLRTFAASHPRWGFRRAYAQARADGWHVNHKKIQRLWREEGLRVPVKRRKKRAGTSTADPATLPQANAPNAVWAIDFQFDATNDGKSIKILSVIDEYTRENLGGLVERSIDAKRLKGELEHISRLRGSYPLVLRMDNGPEMISNVLRDWAEGRLSTYYVPPGSPWKNGYIESFNGKMRDECLNLNYFWSLTQARVVIGDWREEYNHLRPHSALGYQTPAQFACARPVAAVGTTSLPEQQAILKDIDQ